MSLDHWWTLLLKTTKYPKVEKLMRPVLSICCSPHVEQSFSVMNNIINSMTTRMDISTYKAIQRVKYDLSLNKTCERYSTPDKLYSPIDRSVCYHMQTGTGREWKQMTATHTPTPSSAKKTNQHNSGHAQAENIKTKIVKGKARLNPMASASKTRHL